MTTAQPLDSRLGDTALMVAVCRAIASEQGIHGLHDRYSAEFVRAAGVPYWTTLLDSSGALMTDDGDFGIKARAMLGHVVARTRFIDSVIGAEFEGDARQLVILGAGFDTRVARLGVLAEAPVFELDIDPVVQCKAAALEGGALAGARKPVLVSVDLAEDWLGRLAQAGWDPAIPTLWLAEGLLGYLHGPEQDALLGTIAERSAPGSSALFEYPSTITGEAAPSEEPARVVEFSADSGALPDLTTLIHVEPRTAPEEFLAGHGWTSRVTDGGEVYREWFSENDDTVRNAALSAQFDTRFITSTTSKEV